MNLKTYQAYSMAEALAAVKRDLGAGAVILNTRSFKRGGMLGLGRKTVIEVTATVEPVAAPPPPPRRSASPPRAAVKAYAGEGGEAVAEHRPSPASEVDRQRTRQMARAMLERHRQRAPVDTGTDADPPVPAGSASATPAPATSAATGSPVAPTGPETAAVDAGDAAAAETSLANDATPPALSPPPPAARRFILTPAEPPPGPAVAPVPTAAADGDAVGVAGPPGPPSIGPPRVTGGVDLIRPRRTPSSAGHPEVRGPIALGADQGEPVTTGPRPEAGVEVRDELSAIRSMVGEVLQRQVVPPGTFTPTMPQRLFDVYLELIGQDMSEELADRIVNDVRGELVGPDLHDEHAVRASVRRHLGDYIPTADEAVPMESPDGRPLTIALVGPTGVGKTTTLAKLAASFKLRHGRRVALITADTYRIAAVDQLRTYASIIGLPVKVVLTPGEMRQAVASLDDCEVVLIDTAGRSQNDAERIEELDRFVRAAAPHEVHLVLSSTAAEKVIIREAEAFSRIGVDKIVLTKLDEAVSFGMLVDVVRKIGKQLSFFTTGQEVPDHIEVSAPDRLARLVLGERVHP